MIYLHGHTNKQKWVLFNYNYNDGLMSDEVTHNHTGDPPGVTPNSKRETTVDQSLLRAGIGRLTPFTAVARS